MKRPDDIDVVNLAQFGTRENGRSTSTSTCPSSGRTDPCSTTDPAARSTRWPTTASGATRTCPGGWGFPGGRKTGIREDPGAKLRDLMGCLTRTSSRPVWAATRMPVALSSPSPSRQHRRTGGRPRPPLFNDR